MEVQDLLERVRVAEERAEAAEKARAADAAEHARLMAAKRERAEAAEKARAADAAEHARLMAAERERADAERERANAAERKMESNFKLFVESRNNEFKQPQRKCTFFRMTLKRLKNVLLFS
jgi:hypothetical protein